MSNVCKLVERGEYTAVPRVTVLGGGVGRNRQ